MRWAPEYRGASLQAYQLARLQLDQALRTKTWTAAPEQTSGFSKLPPAIIFDLDETVFDNALYNAYSVRENAPYNEADWEKWNQSGLITAMPGATAFVKYAASRGAAIFYITNRSASERTVTIANLHRLGLPIRSQQHLLLKGERPAWTSDKTHRRAFVAQKYRVLMLVGDDFNDFLSAPRDATPQQRLQLNESYASYWGTRWIILPNPVYGSWERSIIPDSKATEEQKLQQKLKALQGFNPSLKTP